MLLLLFQKVCRSKESFLSRLKHQCGGVFLHAFEGILKESTASITSPYRKVLVSLNPVSIMCMENFKNIILYTTSWTYMKVRLWVPSRFNNQFKKSLLQLLAEWSKWESIFQRYPILLLDFLFVMVSKTGYVNT